MSLPGEEHVPQIPERWQTDDTQEARAAYVTAWNDWRARPSMSNAITRDKARRTFYAVAGRAALEADGVTVPVVDRGR